MSDFVIKSGDTLPLISSVLGRADGSTADLSTATSVTFVMRQLTAAAPVVSRVASIIGSPVNGLVSYTWQVADTATPGNYLAVWDVVFADGTKETFPTSDYLEVEVQLNLATAGAIPVLRPTDGIRPRVSEVGAVIPNRGRSTNNGLQFGPRITPSYGQVQQIISGVAGEIDGELAGVALTPQLATMARWAMVYAAAATVELSFFPEQSSNAGDTSGILWSRYQTLLTRLKTLIEEDEGGSPEFGSAQGMSWTVKAANDVINDPSFQLLNDPFGIGSPFGAQ